MPTKSATRKPARFRQICELLPSHLVAKLAREHRAPSRGITPWSHVVSLLYAQFTHSPDLNDVCDALSANRGAFWVSRVKENMRLRCVKNSWQNRKETFCATIS